MKKYLIFSGLVMLLLVFSALSLEKTGEVSTPPMSISQANFAKYTMPVDVSSTENNATALGTFAWGEMLALNWAATYDGVHNVKRGEHDKSWNYTQSGMPYAVVWETFAHRTELRPANKTTADFDKIPVSDYPGLSSFDNHPHYTFGKPGAPLTITPAKTPYSTAKTDLLNCLDEDNEIGSCILFAEAQTSDTSALDNLVLYQAKINRAGFEYKAKYFNGGYDASTDSTAVGRAAAKGALPTIAKGVTRADYMKANKSKIDKIAKCDDNRMITDSGVICFPCSGVTYPGETKPSDGIIEIKTAWRRYNPAKDQGKLDNYFHREAIYFTKDSDSEYTAHNDIFLLIGMHIIRKTQHYPTFIIATFEHVDVEKDDYKYVSKPGGDGDYDELYNIKPVKRIHSYIDDYKSVNKKVHTLLSANNPNHYLNHYRLAGVQGAYTTGYPTEADPKLKNAFYLANYVIESDKALGNFYGSFPAPQKGNKDGFFNTVTKGGNVITTGGCKGCHGVAQTGGKDMSFLMDNGKPADHPDAGIITQPNIYKDYLTPYLLVQSPTSVFLSTTSYYPKYSQYLPNGYVYANKNSNNQLRGVGYNSEFKNSGFLDDDGYPKTNFEFVAFKADKNNPYTGTVQLKKTIPKSSKNTNIHVYYDSKANLFNLSNGTPAPTTFSYVLKKGGFMELYLPSGKSVTVDNNGVLRAGKTKKTAQQFMINGFTEGAFDNVHSIK